MTQAASQSTTLSLTGDLTINTVSRLFEKLTARVTGPDPCSVIDLGDTARVDSAGLALLLEWQSRALAKGEPLRLVNAPRDILRLARLCEASTLLGLEDGAEETVDDMSANR